MLGGVDQQSDQADDAQVWSGSADGDKHTGDEGPGGGKRDGERYMLTGNGTNKNRYRADHAGGQHALDAHGVRIAAIGVGDIQSTAGDDQTSARHMQSETRD